MTTKSVNSDFEIFGVEPGNSQTVDAFPSAVLVPQFSPTESQKRTMSNPWPPQLVVDLALALDDSSTILARYDLTEDQLNHFYDIPAFKKAVATTMRELREDGVSFSRKAAAQAETYLDVMYQMMYEETTPASTKLEIFKTLTKYGRLEPKEEKDNSNNAPQINVQINL